MKAYVFEIPGGAKWGVPVKVIATHRAKHYAHEFGNDVGRSLAEDTEPLFEDDPFEVSDWARNNMNWNDVKHAAFEITPPPPIDFQWAWIEARSWKVEDISNDDLR